MSAAGAEKLRTAFVFFPFPSAPSLDEHGDKLGRENRSRNAPAHAAYGIPGLNGIATAVMASATGALHMVRCRKFFHWAPPFPVSRKPR